MYIYIIESPHSAMYVHACPPCIYMLVHQACAHLLCTKQIFFYRIYLYSRLKLNNIF